VHSIEEFTTYIACPGDQNHFGGGGESTNDDVGDDAEEDEQIFTDI